AKRLLREAPPFTEQVDEKNFDDKDYLGAGAMSNEQLRKELEKVEPGEAKWDEESPLIPPPQPRQYRNKGHQ
uniref:mL129 n=1 Tax=Polytomella magna TaxID=353565 RepID=UPI002240E4CF|nr:Chain Xj, mL129 [Polytomella magna]8APN_Xj Chain Xj, mL129 [Polytomella magna]8APO_Xj Chain Xj, mL129 [Polytomella magna]